MIRLSGVLGRHAFVQVGWYASRVHGLAVAKRGENAPPAARPWLQRKLGGGLRSVRDMQGMRNGMTPRQTIQVVVSFEGIPFLIPHLSHQQGGAAPKVI